MGADLDGRSFLPVLRAQTTAHRDRIFTTHANDNRFNVVFADGHAEFLRVTVGVNATEIINAGVIALDADTGRYLWHYQENPREAWDYKSTPNIVTATLTIDRDQAARFGIQPQVIDDTLYDAFGQRQITQYFTQINTHRLILEVMPGLAGDLETLNKLYVRSNTGAVVPLSAFVKWSTAPVQPLAE